jgi:hypothetical protein
MMNSKMMASGGMMKSKMMASGGKVPKGLAEHAGKPASKAHAGLKAGGMTKMGSVKTAAPSKDGIATKGKTKGTMIKMARGGKAC